MKLRHEIWLSVDENFASYVDVLNYSGSITSYLEIVADNSEGSTNDVLLVDSSTNTHATITVDASSGFKRYRVEVSSALTTDTYFLSNIDSGNVTINRASIIIMQDTTSDNLQDSESQFEIGTIVTIDPPSESPVTVVGPKYWYYDSSKWDGTVTFYVDAWYMTADNMSAVTLYLYEDDGSFGNWSLNETIINGGVSESFVRVKTAFTPTNGRNYKLYYEVSNDMYAVSFGTVKIIVEQTASEPAKITKLEEWYHFFSEDISFTGLMDRDQLYDANEWDGVTVNLYPEHAQRPAFTVTTKIQEDPNGTPSDVANSSITGTNRTRGGTALSITDDETIDSNVVASGNDVFSHRMIAQIEESVAPPTFKPQVIMII